MRRLLFFLVWLGVVVWCGSASAGVLVFQRPAAGASAVIVVARSTDGGAPRVIGRGSAPVVSPDGRKVAFLQPRVACPRALFAEAGCHRLLVADIATGAIQQLAPYAEAPIAWSADSRYLASQDSNQDNLNTQVIRIRSRRRDVSATGVGGGFGIVESIAFSPDDSRVLSCANDGGTLDFTLAPTAGGRVRAYGARGECWAAWSRYSLAYTKTNGNRYDATSYTDVQLRAGTSGRERTVYRLGQNSDISLKGWSATGVLLAATSDAIGEHAVVIYPLTGAAAATWTALPSGTGLAVDAISRNATRVLVEQNNQILAIDTATGAITVLATNAAAATWND